MGGNTHDQKIGQPKERIGVLSDRHTAHFNVVSIQTASIFSALPTIFLIRFYLIFFNCFELVLFRPRPKQSEKIFLVIHIAFSCFLVGFRYSLDLFAPAFHRCSEAVCGHLCGQKRFPPKTGDFHQPRTGSVLCFRLSHCNSERAVMQVLSARSAAQSLRRYKQGNRGFSFPLP